MNMLDARTEAWNREALMLPIWWQEDSLFLLDQRAFPFEKKVVHITDIDQLCKAIVSMQIRGSGAIGIAGAYGMYLASRSAKTCEDLESAAGKLIATRPTAINLRKTVEEILQASCNAQGDWRTKLEGSVVAILDRQLAFERKLGSFGAALLADGDSVLTHCNSGAYAGSGYGGRALSVLRSAWEQGKKIHVYVSETRPYLQGARITAFELGQLGIPCTLITDSSSAFLMRSGKIQKVVVGSDRVAGNGDLVNKIGTYMHAIAAHHHQIPFYTATSSHTIDFSLATGDGCPIEFRNQEEVKHIQGVPIALKETQALYPSFDITPNELIAGIITEKGVITAPYSQNLLVLNN